MIGWFTTIDDKLLFINQKSTVCVMGPKRGIGSSHIGSFYRDDHMADLTPGHRGVFGALKWLNIKLELLADKTFKL